ncbi:hypothetical protein ACSSNL_13335 [Thalassobius sp. S69A]|uniref:hypothetical protein n=1 Tax=unclassified Thalassovita TaxID=2619711 RepID=UPI003C7B5854
MIRIVALAGILVGSQALAGPGLYQKCIEEQLSVFSLRDAIAVKSAQFGVSFRNVTTGSDTPAARQADADFKALLAAANALVASHDAYCREFTPK